MPTPINPIRRVGLSIVMPIVFLALMLVDILRAIGEVVGDTGEIIGNFYADLWSGE